MSPRILRGGLLTALGGGFAITVAVLGYIDKVSDSPPHSLALIVLCAIAAVAAFAAGVTNLSAAHQAAHGGADAPVSYRHTYPLFALIVFVLLGAATARLLAVPAGFGRYGHFRPEAPKDEMNSRQPRYQGKKVCFECHDYQFNNHEKDAHRTVECEDCHGPGDVHVVAEKKTDNNIIVPKSKDWCLVCHRQLTARPGAFPQVTWRDHYKFVGVKKEGVECQECHDPHEPLFLTKPLAEARLHPIVHRCRDCHLNRTDETAKRPEAHPAIFECGYCHEKQVKELPTSKHKSVECTTCHLFLRESDFAGRIVRNTDPRFCLLCHGKTDFRSAEADAIAWPDHLKDVKSASTDESTACVKCHPDEVHGQGKGEVHE